MRLKQITPFVPCTSLARQVAFYRDILGFEVGFQADTYAFLRRDDVAVRLVEVFKSVDLAHPERQGSFYIDVDGIDALFARLKPALDTLPEGRVRAPFDQDYGQREFHVADEDCTLVFFGEAVGRS
ncbi:bleomycin resistance protein [Mesobacterium pallidum]|uniref:bleomycin resistance protein n=1 Tax=Mesobacterium pallidum TaxID=2872037 RepID=UPI001EE28FB9|nr:VOC family protein [Mesobacterium pallidum]